MKFAFRIFIHHKLSCMFSNLNYSNGWRVRRLADLTNRVWIQGQCKLVFFAFIEICLEFPFFCFSIWINCSIFHYKLTYLTTHIKKKILKLVQVHSYEKPIFRNWDDLDDHKTLDSAIKVKSIWHSAMYLFSMRWCTPDVSLFIDLFLPNPDLAS